MARATSITRLRRQSLRLGALLLSTAALSLPFGIVAAAMRVVFGNAVVLVTFAVLTGVGYACAGPRPPILAAGAIVLLLLGASFFDEFMTIVLWLQQSAAAFLALMS